MQNHIRNLALGTIFALVSMFPSDASAIECTGGFECHVVIVLGVPVTYCKVSAKCGPATPPQPKEK